MSIRAGWHYGNHWAVAHKCGRCGTIVYRLYEQDEPGEENIQCLNAPDGWSNVGSTLMCPECTDSYRKWLKGELENELENRLTIEVGNG